MKGKKYDFVFEGYILKFIAGLHDLTCFQREV
jgi:hypothetical protein